MSDDGVVVKPSLLDVRLIILPLEEARRIDSFLNRCISSSADVPSDADIQSVLGFAMQSPHRLWHLFLELGRRLHSPSTWASAIKGLVIFHRLLRSCSSHKLEDQVLQTLACTHENRKILTLTPLVSFHLVNSDPTSEDGSSLVRSYAQFLRQRVRCAGKVGIGQWGYRDECDGAETGGPLRGQYWTSQEDAILLSQVHELQILLELVLSCLPSILVANLGVAKMALEHVLWDSFDLYGSLNYALVELVERFGTMPTQLGMEAMNLCRKAGKQSERLADLYRVYGKAGIGHGVQYPKVVILGETYLRALEACLTQNYSAPLRSGSVREHEKKEGQDGSVESAIRRMMNPQASPSSSASSSYLSTQAKQQFDENARSLFGSDWPLTTPYHSNTMHQVSTPQQSQQARASIPVPPQPQMGGGFDQAMLDSLYEAALAHRQVYANSGQRTMSNDPFLGSIGVPPPPYVQMAQRAQQQMTMLLQQRMMDQHAHYSDLLRQPSQVYTSTPFQYSTNFGGLGLPSGPTFVPHHA